jgi:hypothetical protein
MSIINIRCPIRERLANQKANFSEELEKKIVQKDDVFAPCKVASMEWLLQVGHSSNSGLKHSDSAPL